MWPFDSYIKTTVSHVKSGIRTTSKQIYKGYVIFKRGDGEFEVPQLDKDSYFDTLNDAKRFINANTKKGMKNPGKKVFFVVIDDKTGLEKLVTINLVKAEKYIAKHKDHHIEIIETKEDNPGGLLFYSPISPIAIGEKLGHKISKRLTNNGLVIKIKNPADWLK